MTDEYIEKWLDKAEAAKIDDDFDDIDVDELSDFSIEIRYPDNFFIPEIDEVKFYYDLAIKIKRLVLKKMVLFQNVWVA